MTEGHLITDTLDTFKGDNPFLRSNATHLAVLFLAAHKEDSGFQEEEVDLMRREFFLYLLAKTLENEEDELRLGLNAFTKHIDESGLKTLIEYTKDDGYMHMLMKYLFNKYHGGPEGNGQDDSQNVFLNDIQIESQEHKNMVREFFLYVRSYIDFLFTLSSDLIAKEDADALHKCEIQYKNLQSKFLKAKSVFDAYDTDETYQLLWRINSEAYLMTYFLWGADLVQRITHIGEES